MESISERKLERMNSGLSDTLSRAMYNAVIIGLVLYGFLVNALMMYLVGDSLAGLDSPVVLIGYLVCVLAGSFCTSSNKPALSFLGYNLIVVPIGVILSQTLPFYQHVVMEAVLLTGSITAVMMALATIFPDWFLGMGRTLAVSLLASLIGNLAAALMRLSTEPFAWIISIIFTLYIGFDLSRAQVYPKTLDNAIDSACDLYMDIINLFLRLLRILSKARRD